MALNRKLHALLVGCVVFGMVVSAGTPEHLRAQSRPSKPASSRAGAANSKSAARADVERFRQRAEAALSAAGPDKGAWGVLVTDAATGEVLYARNADGYFMPASNAKLFTTALALATLGPDYRVRTTVASSGTIDANGVLIGDLVLIGRGDANLSNRKFPYGKKEEREGPPEKVLAEFADAVAARGVKEITGDVIADDSMFQHEKFPSGWLVDDILWSYGAAVSAIAVNDNTFSLEVRPGANEGDPARYEAGLAADFYSIENLVRTGARGSEEKLAVARDPGSRADSPQRHDAARRADPQAHDRHRGARRVRGQSSGAPSRSPRSENRWQLLARATREARPQTLPRHRWFSLSTLPFRSRTIFA